MLSQDFFRCLLRECNSNSGAIDPDSYVWSRNVWSECGSHMWAPADGRVSACVRAYLRFSGTCHCGWLHTGNPVKAVSWSVGSFVTVGAVSWGLCRYKFQSSKDNIARVMGGRTRDPTPAEIAETRAHLKRVRELHDQQANDAAVDASVLMIDPRLAAAALNTPDPVPAPAAATTTKKA